MKGLEPSTFCMASRRSSQLSYIREVPELYRGYSASVRSPLFRACLLTALAVAAVLVAVHGAVEIAGDRTDGLDHVVTILAAALLADIAGLVGCVWLLRQLAGSAVGRTPGWAWGLSALVAGATAALVVSGAGFATGSDAGAGLGVLASVPAGALGAWALLLVWRNRSAAR